MASYSHATSKHPTFTANTADSVTITASNTSQLEVISRGDGEIWYRTDGTDATVKGDGCFYIPPYGIATVNVPGNIDTVSLICSSAIQYTVQGITNT